MNEMEFEEQLHELSKVKDFECGNGATAGEIETAENELGVKFPYEYRAFLAQFSYASWFGHYIAGIKDSVNYGIVKGTQYHRERRECPQNAVVLDTDFLMFCEDSSNPGKVMNILGSVTSYETQEWDSFSEYLAYKLSA